MRVASSSAALWLLGAAAFTALPAACGDSSVVTLAADAGSLGEDAGARTDAQLDAENEESSIEASTPVDAGADVEESGGIQSEKEPNNGATAVQLNKMTIPGTMTGAIDPANDLDLFSIGLSPGELWSWTLTPTGGDLAPHFSIFDTTPDNLNPTVLVAGGVNAPLLIEHFVLRSGTFVAAVRDARNVPTGTGKGGPSYGYSLVATKVTPTPVAVTFPATKTGTLSSLGAVDLYTFTGTGGKGFDIVIRARRKASPSTLDSRLSLYDLTTAKAIITNADAMGTLDSEIGSADPTADAYMVIVESEGTDATDLSYEIEFSLRP